MYHIARAIINWALAYPFLVLLLLLCVYVLTELSWEHYYNLVDEAKKGGPTRFIVLWRWVGIVLLIALAILLALFLRGFIPFID